MPFMTVNSHTLHYTDSCPTTKPAATIIFIHGLGSTQNYFFPILPYLIDKYRCVTFDNYGAGRSPLSSPDSTTSIQSIADDALSILEKLGVDQAVVVGYSMGGMVPTTLAASHPQRVLGCILIGPVHPTPQVAEVFQKRIPLVEKDGMDSMANTIPTAATGAAATTATMMAFIREMLLAQSVPGYVANCRAIENATPPDYASVSCPVLIVAGSEDKSAPVSGCRYILENLGSQGRKGGDLQVLEGVGHWACVESPEKVGSLVSEFLGRLVGP